MRSIIYVSIFYLFIGSMSHKLRAQGCVAVRQMGGINPLSSNGYTLPKGEFQIGTSYRYFHSFRHFIGSVEQPQRQTKGGGFDENGREKGNAVNIYSHAIDLNLSYALTNRIQINVSIPYVSNERSQVLAVKKDSDGQTTEGIRYSVYAKGLGDIRINSTFWVFDPAKATQGNLLIGAGLKLNTGSHTAKDNGLALDDSGNVVTTRQTMDQAIQPGDGGIGFLLSYRDSKKYIKTSTVLAMDIIYLILKNRMALTRARINLDMMFTLVQINILRALVS